MAERATSDIPVLSRAGHDRAGARRHDEQWLGQAWPRARVVPLSATQTTPFAQSDGGVRLALRTGADVDQSAPRTFLGETADAVYFAVPAEPNEGQTWLGLRELGGQLDDLGAGLLTAAVALANWHATHTHCPRCGAVTDVIEAGWARRCPVDGSQHFPRTDPAVIMLVHDGGDRCVLGRQSAWANARYSILAGFVEAGEAAEAAVAREVYEEVGLQIADIEYRSSQPWPFPASLMLGFTARATGDLTITRHDDELADAGWFTRAEIRAAVTWGAELDRQPGAESGAAPRAAPTSPGGGAATASRLGALPGGISIARHLIEAWLAD